jgi:hypothetical protein
MLPRVTRAITASSCNSLEFALITGQWEPQAPPPDDFLWHPGEQILDVNRLAPSPPFTSMAYSNFTFIQLRRFLQVN